MLNHVLSCAAVISAMVVALTTIFQSIKYPVSILAQFMLHNTDFTE